MDNSQGQKLEAAKQQQDNIECNSSEELDSEQLEEPEDIENARLFYEYYG